jgi:hypothetical protein
VPLIKHIGADADRILHVIRSALFDQASVRIVKDSRQPERTSFIEVHPDGLVELWAYDGKHHRVLMSVREPRATP